MNVRVIAAACVVFASMCFSQQATTPAEKLIFVKMTTSAGDIIIELNNEKAPISVANFLKYAERHAYDGTVFHRVIPWFVIQGGGFTNELVEQKSDPPIKNEWNNGLKNIRGTIAMARDAAPDTATREFYFNVADNARLDTARPTTGNAGYAVFGRVISGMDVVDAIRDGVTGPRADKADMEDVPESLVTIISVTRMSVPDGQARAAEAKSGRNPWKLWRMDAPIDGLPTGFEAAETNGAGRPAKWRIAAPVDPIKPTTPPAAVHCEAANAGSAFNLLLASETSTRDVSVQVKIHADQGKEDQGGGIIWRCSDANNYYVVRWNPLENNLRVYHVKGGKRTQIGSADVKADPKDWHRVRIDHTGAKIQASFDGKTVLTIEDSTFPDAGKIGLWTKADASTWFDDLAAVDNIAK